MSTLAIDSRLKLQLLLWYGVLAVAVLLLGIFLASDLHFIAMMVAGVLGLATLPYHAQIAARVAIVTFGSALVVPFLFGFMNAWEVAGFLGWSGAVVTIMLRHQSASFGETLRRNKCVYLGVVGFSLVMFILMRAHHVGFHSLGGTSGARQYVANIICAIFPVLFALTDMNEKTVFRLIVLQYALMFTFLVPDLAVATGKFQWVFYMLTPPVDSFNFEQNFQNFGFRRLQSFQSLGLGIVGVLLLYNPLRRFLTGRGIWLLPALAIGLGVGLLSGHRSFFISLVIMFAIMAWAQRFFTMRHQLLVGCVLVPLLAFVYIFADALPDAGQRAVSFLPGIQVNAKAELDANGTYMMRKEMATIGIKMIPHNLWIGRGFPIWNAAFNSAEHPDLRTINLFVEQGAFASGLIGLMVDTGLPGCLCMLLVILGGSIASWRIFRETRRPGYEDRFALACCLSAASWLSTLFGFVFIQGNACAAMLTLGLPCGLVILCERMLRQRAQPGADEVPVAQGVGGS